MCEPGLSKRLFLLLFFLCLMPGDQITGLAQGQRSDSEPVARTLEGVEKLNEQARYAEAETLARELLKEAEQKYGPDSLEVAKVLDPLVSALWRGGKLNQAETKELAWRVVAIKEKALGPEHLDLVFGLSNLGALLSNLGDYAGAKPIFERVLAITEKAQGSDHPSVATSLGNLAILLYYMGDYAGAKPLYERALSIKESAVGAEHPSLAYILMNFANLQSSMGDHAVARRQFERAIVIWEKALGPDHPNVAGCLMNLATLLTSIGEYEEARPIHERALRIREKALGPDHPEVATSLTNLADLLDKMGDHDDAKPLHKRSLAIKEKALGPENPELAYGLTNFALSCQAMGDPVRARSLHERAIRIFENAVGPEHPDLATLLSEFSKFLLETRDYEKCFEAALRAESISRQHLRLTGSSLPERQALRYASVRPSGLDVIFSLCVGTADRANREPNRAMALRAWDALIRSRALVLDEMAKRQQIAAEAHRISRVAQRFAATSQRYANLMVRGPGGGPADDYREMVEEAREEKEKAEQALAASSTVFRVGLARKEIGVGQVVASLPNGSAMVAFARYIQHPVTHERKGEEIRDGGRDQFASDMNQDPFPSYMAFVLRPGSKAPATVFLGGAPEIEELISRWRNEAGSGSTREEASYRETGKLLREKVWDPIVGHLGDAKRVFVVPDGELHLVSLASLPVAEDRFLIETGPLIHYLSSERDLVPSGTKVLEGEGLLVLGDPAFDEASLFASLAKERTKDKTESVGEKIAAWIPFRGEQSGCSDFQSVMFQGLPGTAGETNEIRELWNQSKSSGKGRDKIVFLTGAAASEASFKARAPGRRVLHLATHGFFLSGTCSSALDSTRGIAGKVPLPGEERHYTAGENPLRLSGLALAGFNRRNAAGPEEEDGVLTAEEIAAMDLSGVEWAVLSACETGVGEVRAGEGVFGLRRAFQVAGAASLIMSLWSVEDQATRQWMNALYEARLTHRKQTAAAVRDASLAILKQRREQGKSTHPFYWAAFVATGDWR